MSLIPLLLNDILGDDRRPVNLFDQHFGLGMLSDELKLHSMISPLRVNLDVQQFKPEELTVKMVDDFIVIEGKHEEREDEHGYIARQFQRRYKIPKDVNHEAIQSQLSSDGVLTITVPKLALTDSGKEKVIPITQTQKPALQLSTSQKQEKSDNLES
ncbi:Protein lethal(2)essential for life [Blattella germanica]|nr:Protein lethal(2)essential for life [Blattella germanica]